MKPIFTLILSVSLALTGVSQTTELNLENIFLNPQFSSKGVAGFRASSDGLHYWKLENGRLNKFAFKDDALKSSLDLQGQPVKSFEITQDESQILFPTNVEYIYRYSFLAEYKILNFQSGAIENLSPSGPQKHASLSPNGKMAAYVINNNLVYRDLTDATERWITQDGKENEIINGASDWVYEEEFTLIRAYEWSPNSDKIAYYRFDETTVPTFSMNLFFGQTYPQNYTFKYPKVGEENSKIALYIYTLEGGTKTPVKISTSHEYFPRITWTPDGKSLLVTSMNRLQNELIIWKVNPETGESSPLLTENSATYIEIHDNLTFLPNNKGFLWTSEKDGYNHIYHYDANGNRVRQITSGNWEVTAFHGYDEKAGLIYFSSSETSPLERQLYAVKLDGKGKKQLTTGAGWHETQFTSGLKYYMDVYSSAGVPATYTLFEASGKQLKVLEENKALKEKLALLNLAPVEFLTIAGAGEDSLNGFIMKPTEIPANSKLPVLMFVYGGPGSQMVKNAYGIQYYTWFQYLVKQGYIVACFDNRGTGARGRTFRTITYGQLGKYETEDQVAAANYLKTIEYVNKDRIGIFGWSYGGYMSSLCLTRGGGTFKAGIAVAPVTNWKWYDNIYTERYMGTLESNPKGFDANSPITYAGDLQGNYLLIHGTADDNVHWQNTAEMITALTEAGEQFDLFVYPDKNHGIGGNDTRYHLFTLLTDFLREKL